MDGIENLMVNIGAGMSRMSASFSSALCTASSNRRYQLAVPGMRCREKRWEAQQTFGGFIARHARFRYGAHQNCRWFTAFLQTRQHSWIPSLRRIRYIPSRYQSSGAQYKKESLFINTSFPCRISLDPSQLHRFQLNPLQTDQHGANFDESECSHSIHILWFTHFFLSSYNLY